MSHVRLIHWNADEAEKRAERLRAAGYRVSSEPLSADFIRRLREATPAAVVVDLSRLPSQGRDVGLMVRQSKSTRHLPLVFVDGDPAKIELVKKQLPDAVYTSWSRIRSALKRAIANPPTDPVVPKSSLAGYSGTPLPKKLGIKADSVVILVNAPQGFEKTLGKLPDGVTLRRQARGRCDLVIWFTKSLRELGARIETLGALAGKDGIWIAWPKKTSGHATDVSQTDVRNTGLGAGLVDYKICAIDETWSGLKFTRRKSTSR